MKTIFVIKHSKREEVENVRFHRQAMLTEETRIKYMGGLKFQFNNNAMTVFRWYGERNKLTRCKMK